MILFAAISVFFASLIKGITAFGFNLIAVAALISFLSPKLLVPVITLLSVTSSCYMLVGLIHHIEIRRILPLLLGAAAGIPLGVFGLVILRPEILKILIGLVVVTFALLFATGYRKEIRNETPAFLLAGFISGILGGSTSLGGVPVILFFINQDCDKLTFRANLTLFYVMHGTLSFLGYLAGNLITGEVIQYYLLLLIPLTLGIVAGMKLVHKVNQTLFRQIALLILILSGVASIYTGLKAILP